MSIGSYSAGEAALSGQSGSSTLPKRKTPGKRTVTAQADTTQAPEPR